MSRNISRRKQVYNTVWWRGWTYGWFTGIAFTSAAYWAIITILS